MRWSGNTADFSRKATHLGKQIKRASAKKAQKCVIIGQELLDNNELVVKNMATGEQVTVKADIFLSKI